MLALLAGIRANKHKPRASIAAPWVIRPYPNERPERAKAQPTDFVVIMYLLGQTKSEVCFIFTIKLPIRVDPKLPIFVNKYLRN